MSSTFGNWAWKPTPDVTEAIARGDRIWREHRGAIGRRYWRERAAARDKERSMGFNHLISDQQSGWRESDKQWDYSAANGGYLRERYVPKQTEPA